MDELARLYGENIERGRKLLGLTQDQLADLIGVTQPSVAKWERGDNVPRDHHKVKLATVLRQEVRQLFPLTGAVA